jgi:4-hydroxy-tetrahydrodipicolinate synthase
MPSKKFIGTGVAIVTPFRDDESIDFSALEKLIEYQIENGTDYIVALGTTGESVTLNKEEKEAVVTFIVEKVDARVPIVVGVGGNNTQQILNDINTMTFDGVDAILSVCPYYNKPSQEGIFQHYKTIASYSPVPVILYNVPGRTGVNIKAETTLKLARVENIIGVKEASGNLAQVMRILRKKPKNFLVVSGDDALTLPLIAVGGNGVISVIANTLPREFSNMVKLALLGKLEEAREINFKLLDMYKLLFDEGNPAGVKAALTIQGIISNNLRLPLIPVSAKLYKKIEKSLGELG